MIESILFIEFCSKGIIMYRYICPLLTQLKKANAEYITGIAKLNI